MNRRRRELQVFNLSFLDAISCALGGVLLLWLMAMTNAQQQQQRAQDELRQRDQTIAAHKSEAQARADKIEELKREVVAATAMVGFKGSMEDVVFVFDTSSSMDRDGRFEEYRQMLNEWVKRLAFKRFNVVHFDAEVEVWKPGSLAPADEAARQAAVEWIGTRQLGNATSTLGALQAAFGVSSEIDTLIMITDGVPTDAPSAEIERWLETENEDRDITINCVALGDYLHDEDPDEGYGYGQFLRRLAEAHGGAFFGR